MEGKHICGGSLVTTIRLLTAAQCVQPGTSTTSYTVLAGTEDCGGGHSGQWRYVLHFARHPKYNPFTKINDIAIVQVEHPFEFSWNLRAIDLPPQDASIANEAKVNVTGWWNLHEDSSLSSPVILQVVTQTVVSTENCNSTYEGRITPDMVCAVSTLEGDRSRNGAQGESGAPLVFQGVLHGIGSLRRSCVRLQSPNVYARVSYFTNWIQNFDFHEDFYCWQ